MVCKSHQNKSSVEHYYNENYYSRIIDASNPQLAITETKISNFENILMCSFTRDNKNDNIKVYDIKRQKPYVLIAYGSLDDKLNLKKHFKSGVTLKQIDITQLRSKFALKNEKNALNNCKKTFQLHYSFYTYLLLLISIKLL